MVAGRLPVKRSVVDIGGLTFSGVVTNASAVDAASGASWHPRRSVASLTPRHGHRRRDSSDGGRDDGELRPLPRGTTTARRHHRVDHHPKTLLDAATALSALHVKFGDSSKSVVKIFKRFNKTRVGKLSHVQVGHMLANYHLFVDERTITEMVDDVKRRHGDQDGSGTLSLRVFTKEFGHSISGTGFVGLHDENKIDDRADRARRHMEQASTPCVDAATATKLFISKLTSTFKHNRVAWEDLKTTRNSALDYEELRSALTRYHLHLTDAEFAKFVRQFDPTRRGWILFHEFVARVGNDISGVRDEGGLSTQMHRADEQRHSDRWHNQELRELDGHDETDEASSKSDDGGGDDGDPEITHEVARDGGRAGSWCSHDVSNLALLEPTTRRRLHQAISFANQETLLSVGRKTDATAKRRQRSCLQRSSRDDAASTPSTSSTRSFSPRQSALSSRLASTSRLVRSKSAAAILPAPRGAGGPRIVTHNRRTLRSID